MTERSGRTQPCDRAQARLRFDNAKKSLEVAELAAGEQEIPASRSVTVKLQLFSVRSSPRETEPLRPWSTCST